MSEWKDAKEWLGKQEHSFGTLEEAERDQEVRQIINNTLDIAEKVDDASLNVENLVSSVVCKDCIGNQHWLGMCYGCTCETKYFAMKYYSQALKDVKR